MLTLAFAGSVLHAGIFDSLFGTKPKKSDVKVEEVVPEQSDKKKMIVEEEVISADEYIDSSDENEDAIFEESPAVPEEQAISDEESEVSEVTQSEGDREVDPFIKVKNILLSYTQKPEKIYLGEHFVVKLKAIIPETNITAIETGFIGGKSYKIFNRDNPWVQTGTNSYENSFIFKLLDKDAKLPNIKVRNQSAGGKVQSEIIKPFRAKLVTLREDELFSRVIGEDLHIVNHQERPYDEHSNIVVMEINATRANLEDFHIPYALREGIDDIKVSGDAQKIYYFAIVSNMRKDFRFKYFDPRQKRYEMVSFPIRPIDTSISTHTELNPQKSRYIFYKALFLVVMALLFVALFIFRRNYIFLLLAALFIIALAYVQIPITKAKLPAGTALRILPMANSTLFFRTDQPMEVDILLKKKRYTKVLLPNKKIGWVKNEAIR